MGAMCGGDMAVEDDEVLLCRDVVSTCIPFLLVSSECKRGRKNERLFCFSIFFFFFLLL
jgi:hypothetical protein